MLTLRRIVGWTVLAATLLVTPGVGVTDARADCKLKIRVCEKIKIIIWEGEVCIEYCLQE